MAVFGLYDKSDGDAPRVRSLRCSTWRTSSSPSLRPLPPRTRRGAGTFQTLDMQIYPLYAFLAGIGELRIWGQARNHTAVQKTHVFPSGGSVCLLCDGALQW